MAAEIVVKSVESMLPRLPLGKYTGVSGGSRAPLLHSLLGVSPTIF